MAVAPPSSLGGLTEPGLQAGWHFLRLYPADFLGLLLVVAGVAAMTWPARRA